MRRFLTGLFLGLLVTTAVARQGATNITTSGTLPANCTVGNVYVKTGGSAGLYVCLATNTWTAVSGGGGSGALSALTAATGANAITSGNNLGQDWGWAPTSLGSALKLYENTAATGGDGAGDQSILKVGTLAGSTAVPLVIDNFGAGYSLRVNDQATDTNFFVVNDDGRVMIHGTGTPTAWLDVNGATNAYAQKWLDGTNTLGLYMAGTGVAGSLGSVTNGNLGFFTNNGSPQLLVNTSGYTQIQRTTASSLSLANSYLVLGGAESGVNNYWALHFGYNSGTAPPAYIGFQELVDTGNTYGDLIFGTRSVTSNTVPTERLRIVNDGGIVISDLTTTGAAGSKKVVCVDTGTGKLYASSTGTDCSN